jgi:hypothetical protein
LNSIFRNKYFFLSSFIGFLFGIFHFPSLQDAVENAQVIAGIVEYPSMTPQLYFQNKLWSLPPQLLAILLKLGFNEKTLSFFTSGILGLLSFGALSIISRAIHKKDSIYILATPLITFFFLLYDFAPTYDISLLDTSSTSGSIGLSWAVICLGLYLNSKKRIFYFAIGLLASIHATWFIWTSLAVLTHFLFFQKDKSLEIKTYYKYLLSGAGISFLSLCFYLINKTEFSATSQILNESVFLEYFFNNWDVHRRNIPFTLGSLISIALPVLVFNLRDTHRRIFEFSIVLSIFNALTIILSQFSFTLLWLMPHRFINISILIFPVILLSVLQHRKYLLHSLVTLIGIVFLHYYYEFYRIYPEIKTEYLFNVGVFLLVMSGTTLIHHKKAVFDRFNAVAPTIVASLIALYYISFVSRAFEYNLKHYKDISNSNLHMEISKKPGILLTCPNCSHFQLTSRSPILVEIDTMDDLAYAPYVADSFNSILKEVYHLDLMNRPKNWSRTIHVPKDAIKSTWEDRTREEWFSIFKKYGLKGIVTPKHWNLKLSSIKNNKYSFFYIP